MPLARLVSGACVGLEAVRVEIEVDTTKAEKSLLVIVGLPDTAVREAKDRVLTAVKNSGVDISSFACTVNLAPADLKKEGCGFDLPIAIGLLAALGKVPKSILTEYLIIGELGLGGDTRPINGVLAYAFLAKSLGLKGIVLPCKNSQEASLVPGLEVIGVASLQIAVDFFLGKLQIPLLPKAASTAASQQEIVDFATIQGQDTAKLALTVAAAGGHNVLLSGPPGAGKSMLAKALVGIMPKMSFEEALEVTKIYSIAGKLNSPQLLEARPFRAPHHTVSYAGLLGGGSIPRPGEVVLAHNGVLFLDELPEFSRHVLEGLRQPLEERKIQISRALGATSFPCSCLLISAMNPCPCGFLGHPEKPCRDTKLQIDRYQSKISGPLLDRIDLHVWVNALTSSEIAFGVAQESSSSIAERVAKARDRQKARYGSPKTNAELNSKELETYFPMSAAMKGLITKAMDSFGLSMRAVTRAMKVAITLHDLDECDRIEEEHLLQALSYRQMETAQHALSR